jgi:hypothetical protein
MRTMLILLALVLPVTVFLMVTYQPRPPQPVKITTPGHPIGLSARFEELEARVKTLEEYCQRRGRRY